MDHSFAAWQAQVTPVSACMAFDPAIDSDNTVQSSVTFFMLENVI